MAAEEEKLAVELPGKLLEVWLPEEAVAADDPESAAEIKHLGLPKLAPEGVDSEY